MLENTRNLLILSCTPYFGNARFALALKNNIDLNKLISSPNSYSKELKLRKETVDFLVKQKYIPYINKVATWLNTSHNQIITILDSNYPKQLKELTDAPFVLYCSGNIELLNSQQLAIVGARNHSTYGKNVTDKICQELAQTSMTITSGLAYGIDTLAHKFALDNNLPTVGVVGTGVDVIYPSSNRSLYQKIINHDGLIVSEFPLGTGPLRHNFPQRNRIISGLSKGVIVVEAAQKSGSLITAQLALEQNKEVFAVPGSIFSKTSQGCNDLIKQGAKLVGDINDILEEISLDNNHINVQQDITVLKNTQVTDLNEQEQAVFQIIKPSITTLDKIITESKLSYTQVSEILFELEMKDLVESVPGGYIIS